MTKEELLNGLKKANNEDTESGHIVADDLLLAYIDDPDVTAAFKAIAKWYS